MTDPELNEVVKNATARAAELYPKRTLSVKARLALLIAGILIVGNAVIGIIDTAVLNKQTACQNERSAQQTVVAQSDRKVVDHWVNGITDQIVNGKLTGRQLVEQLNKIRDTYNTDRTNNDKTRAGLVATSCK